MKVKVTLAADCYAGGALKQKGETVEVAEEIAARFAAKPETGSDEQSEIKSTPVRRTKKKQ